ncbi:MAG TPA: biotin--[acetyl-CoA-carboxylase] ligase [Steroidobacteraceae bacterium]|nr:biotin--[acetyl-CoA-carboxylase] ligase [Steroidobacteraceae bacterium]
MGPRVAQPVRTPASGAPLAARVYGALASGEFVSGAQLASSLGVSRSAVWKATRSLRDLGVSVHAVRNRGYRVPDATEPLDAARLKAALPRDVRDRVRRLETVWSIDSTNAALLARTDLPPGLTDVMLAEFQTAGRGRLGRTWLAPPGGSICLSVSWSFPQLPRDLGALGLAAGVCALRTLRSAGAAGVALKWPNDLVLENSKLGGILLEMRAEAGGPTYIVAGIGINAALGPALLKKIADSGTQATDLRAVGIAAASRAALVAQLIGSIVRGLEQFEREGLKPFAEEWKRADALRGRAVNVLSANHTCRGVARGIDAGGALLVEAPDGLKKFVSGEVSVRAQS